MKAIAVLTSGGDAPGMNAAIRAVTRSALAQGWGVFGVRHGFRGLIDGSFQPLTARSVGGIIQQGGTLLGSARCPEFKLESARREALRSMAQKQVEGLVVIGGNGSQTGAHALSQMGFPVVGVASTIDNDLVGSDITLGVDTALNIALEAIDRLKTTASSHQRAFLVEVMGRNSGYLALMAGIAGGAEVVVIPEIETPPEQVAVELGRAYDLGKPHALVVVAEGAVYAADKMAAYFKENKASIGFDLRVTTLGHVQRGGAPSAFDRLMGTRLGAAAVSALAGGQAGVLIGLVGSRVGSTPLTEIVDRRKSIDPELFALARVMNQ
jgi:6-phosphofructokinase 1